MTTHNCPVDGCEYGEQENKSLAAVRAHINATNEAEHDWADLKEVVEQQAGGADPSPSTPADPEPEGEQTEAAENPESGGSETAADEYAEQLSDAAGREPDAIEDPDDGADDGGGSGNSTPGLAVLAGTAALGLAVILGRGSDSGPTRPTETETQSSTEETETGGEMNPSPLR